MAENIYFRAVDVKTMQVDSSNNPIADSIEMFIGTKPKFVLRFFATDGSASTDYHRFGTYAMYFRLYADDDWLVATTPKISVVGQTSSDPICGSANAIYVTLDLTDSALEQWIGSEQSKNLICEVQGYDSSASTDPSFLAHFSITIRNRVQM